MRFNEEQQQAMDKIEKWLKSSEKEFRLGGLAGTGKTSLAGEIIKRNPNALVAAFTGKAASRLREKGASNAVTLHKAFKEFSHEEKDISGKYRPVFENSDARYRLAIIDEASMVNRDFYEQTLARCEKALWIGDHGQLPPVNGKGFCVVDEKLLDAKLTQIMRTGEGSGIPKLAKWVRETKESIYSLRDALSSKLPEGVDFDVSTNGVDGAAQIAIESGCFPVIVPTHSARVKINAAYRSHKNLSKNRTHKGEPLICVSNRPHKNLMNGEIFRVEKQIFDNGFIVSKDSDDEWSSAVVLDHQFGEDNGERSGFDVVPCMDAYALTCHKAQGSEWDHVAVLMNSSHFCYDVTWVYTAITRASKRVTIIFC
jgi:exodeoxyribonuclease-5